MNFFTGITQIWHRRLALISLVLRGLAFAVAGSEAPQQGDDDSEIAACCGERDGWSEASGIAEQGTAREGNDGRADPSANGHVDEEADLDGEQDQSSPIQAMDGEIDSQTMSIQEILDSESLLGLNFSFDGTEGARLSSGPEGISAPTRPWRLP